MFDLEVVMKQAHKKNIEVIISNCDSGFDVIASKGTNSYSYCGDNLYAGVNAVIAGCE